MKRGGRRSDRVDYRHTGEEKFYSSNGTLPRMSYRDVEADMYRQPFPAVYPIARRAAQRQPEILRMPSRRLAKPSSKYRSALQDVSFTVGNLPSRVGFCMRRKARREVLFALKRAGFRGSASGSYRRNMFSRYGC